MLDEESWNIASITDVLLVFVCHCFYTSMEEPGSNRRPSNQRLQRRRLFSPGFTPSTATSLSWVSPSVTSRKCATHLPPCSLATKTA